MPKRSHEYATRANKRLKSSKTSVREKIHDVYAQNIVQNERELIFSFTSQQNPIRFLSVPLLLTYIVRKKNPAYAGDNTKAEFLYPKTKDGLLYFMPDASYNFISRTSIAFNGYPIYDSESMGGAYQQANRYVSTETARKQAFASSLEVTERVGYGAIADPLNLTAYQAELFDSCSFDDLRDFRTMALSFDGSGFLGVAKNFGNAVFHDFDPECNKPCIIPPETRVTVRMRLHEDLTKYLINDGVDDSVLLAGKTGTANIASGYHLVIKEAKLQYEELESSVKLKEEYTQYFDTHDTTTADVPTNSLASTLEKSVPHGAKGVMISFAPEAFHYWSQTNNIPASYRFLFPAELIDLKFTLGGEKLIFPEGLKDLGGTTARNKDGAHSLYNYLASNKLISRSFNEMFPKAKNGYAKVIYFDLSDPVYEKLKNRTLSVELRFKETLDVKWNIYYHFVMEQKLSKSKNDIWHREISLPT